MPSSPNVAGTLRVRIKEARELKAKSVVIVLGVNQHEAKTEPGVPSPTGFTWSERFDFILPEHAPTCMKFVVYDSKKKQLTGCCILDYEKLLQKGAGVAERWYSVFNANKQTGELYIVMEFIPKESELQDMSSSSPTSSSPPPLATPPTSPTPLSPSMTGPLPTTRSAPVRAARSMITGNFDDLLATRPKTAPNMNDWSPPPAPTPRVPMQALDTPRTPTMRNGKYVPTVAMDFERVYSDILLSSRPGTAPAARRTEFGQPLMASVPGAIGNDKTDEPATPATIAALLADLHHGGDDEPRAPRPPSAAVRRAATMTF
mmetsp:Transcript_54664/g.90836  ORF Transcript_54664/g.90836 Transcript_54664/m.90836 type:complete len:317 (-) Transcript_54664:560-1510(-)|eukprot:CAMPEP_0184643538 /NCGR_PEP_ID=MMETSP0308-20130426/389_1 /TAXON_ID=38269 /ORGANISM="Gloeochaete witrockiana, Strain SAG 46.84" /LENGTH=316 /DNA_ID=CAMNT_0027071539 /DNA_START=171 /DNA_END=1121 /DNA_ORIENTATION=-